MDAKDIVKFVKEQIDVIDNMKKDLTNWNINDNYQSLAKPKKVEE